MDESQALISISDKVEDDRKETALKKIYFELT